MAAKGLAPAVGRRRQKRAEWELLTFTLQPRAVSRDKLKLRLRPRADMINNSVKRHQTLHLTEGG
jgi:hypothetical protein